MRNSIALSKSPVSLQYFAAIAAPSIDLVWHMDILIFCLDGHNNMDFLFLFFSETLVRSTSNQHGQNSL